MNLLRGVSRGNSRWKTNLRVGVLALAVSIAVSAQETREKIDGLPAAPIPRTLSQAGPAGLEMSAQAPATQGTKTPTPLSIGDAQALALKNNPQISMARLTALASRQVTREARSAL